MSQLDYSDEYTYWDNTEPVTVTIKRPTLATPGVPTSVNLPITIAFREDLDRDTAAVLGVQVTETTQVWNIPAKLLGNEELQVNDVITDTEGGVWTILAAKCLRIGSCKLHWVAPAIKRR